MSASILKSLGLTDVESGTYLGGGEWSKTTDAGTIEVVNPSTHEIIGRVHASSAADYETIVYACAGSVQELAHDAGTEARRSNSPVRRRAAQAQGRARLAGRARNGQDQARRRRRSAGDDRHRRLRARPEPHAVRPVDALGAPRPPHVRAMASARCHRHHFGVQLPGRGVGVERVHCGRLRRHLDLEAVAEDTAVGDRIDEDLQRGVEGWRFPESVLPVQRSRRGAGEEVRRRPSRSD